MECTRNGRWPVLVYSIDLKEKKEFKNRLSSSIYREQCAAFGFDPAKRTPKLFGQMGGGTKCRPCKSKPCSTSLPHSAPCHSARPTSTPAKKKGVFSLEKNPPFSIYRHSASWKFVCWTTFFINKFTLPSGILFFYLFLSH
jgi:hypothetical protein